MKTIETEFKSDGYTSRLLKRDGRLCLFWRGKPGGTPHWEVVILRVAKAGAIMGRQYPEREVMPPNEAWGHEAWSYSDQATAEARFQAAKADGRLKNVVGGHNVPSEDQIASHEACGGAQ